MTSGGPILVPNLCNRKAFLGNVCVFDPPKCPNFSRHKEFFFPPIMHAVAINVWVILFCTLLGLSIFGIKPRNDICFVC